MSHKKTRGAGSVSSAGSGRITEEQVAVRAYERWMGRGCPASDGVEDWLAARHELEAGLSLGAPRKAAAKAKSPQPPASID